MRERDRGKKSACLSVRMICSVQGRSEGDTPVEAYTCTSMHTHPIQAYGKTRNSGIPEIHLESEWDSMNDDPEHDTDFCGRDN